MNTVTFSNALLPQHVQKPFSTVWADQSSEGKPERTEMLPSPVSLMTVALQHQSPSQLKDQDSKHFKDIGWICAYVRWLFCFCVTVRRKMRHARASPGHRCDVYREWEERASFCFSAVIGSHSSVRAPFIKTSLLWLHLELPWCNDKWLLQRAPFNESMWKHVELSLASVISRHMVQNSVEPET